MAAARKRGTRRPVTITEREILWGGPEGEGIVHMQRRNTEQIGRLALAQENTTREIDKLTEAQRTQSETQRRDSRRISKLERYAVFVVVALALVGLFSMFPGAQRAFESLAHLF